MPEGIVGEFLDLKAETDADLLAMQCGDFYEFFGDDAETVGDVLDLKVSQKSSHGSQYPMAGVPLDDLTPYLRALVERGYRVAVADQYETDDGHAREISRVVTPGTLLETTDASAQYLAAVVRDEGVGVALADVTTGRFLTTTVDDQAAAVAELARFDPVEVLPGPDLRSDDAFLDQVREATDASLTLHDAEGFAPGRARHALSAQFGDGALDSVGLGSDAGPGGRGDGPSGAAAVSAAGGVLSYVTETGVGVAQSMTRLRTYDPDDHLALDATTQRNLELTQTMHGDRSGSLLSTVDHTVTSSGRRLLTEWLTRPRRSRPELERRLDCVEALAAAALARDRLRETLGEAGDLERLASRAASGSADASDLLAVRDSLATLPALVDAVAGSRLADSPVAAVLDRPDGDAAADLHGDLEEALVEDPPSTVTEGGLFRRGYDDELDEVIDRHESALEWLDGLAAREKRSHGLTHVTVDRNRTDGYYIQVGKSETDAVPDHYREIKTLKNSRRYVTDELEEREREVLRLEEARADLEYERFQRLRDRVADRGPLLQDVGRCLAEVDALASFATHAATNGWVRPDLVDSGDLHVEAGRHPVVETTTDFVPNDLHLDRDRRFLIVTGPNMSGKSTYMRQAALLVLLAQAGSFVPADAATVGLVDGIYTRVGALDELARGRSTFMVEMQELSNILHSATEDSLVILDEVGRGTATYDGISIAWAATEYLHNEVGANTLFATHYHELTALADRLPGIHNVHMAADERGSDVTFLRTVRDGPADRSYGIHVADLAGVPAPVVERSRDVLAKLRADEAIDVRGGRDQSRQVVFDLGSGELRTGASADGADNDADVGADGADNDADRATATGDGPTSTEQPTAETVPSTAQAVLDELEETDLSALPPVELMARVREWQQRLQ